MITIALVGLLKKVEQALWVAFYQGTDSLLLKYPKEKVVVGHRQSLCDGHEKHMLVTLLLLHFTAKDVVSVFQVFLSGKQTLGYCLFISDNVISVRECITWYKQHM